MTPSPSARLAAALVLLLGLTLALAPATSLAQSSPPDGDGGSQEGEQNRTDGEDAGSSNQTQPDNDTEHREDRSVNETDGSDGTEEDRNASTQSRHDGEEADQADGNASQDRGEGPSDEAEERRNGGPADRPGRADPVEIRERPDGFESRAPPGSQRPGVSVEAGQARAGVARPGVQPLAVQVESFLEYRDEDGDGAYDLGEPVVNRTVLREAEHRIEHDAANATRSVVYQLDGSGELVLRFGFGTELGEQVGAKVDVIVRDRAFQDPDTRIAVGSRVEAQGGLETAEVDGQPAVLGTEGDEVAYLSWVPGVTVDGTEHPVGWSVHLSTSPTDQSAIVYWSYPQGEEIVHDPQLGIASAIQALPGQLAPFALAGLATVVVLGTGYAVRRRGRL